VNIDLTGGEAPAPAGIDRTGSINLTDVGVDGSR
jgi:hypothetical protein